MPHRRCAKSGVSSACLAWGDLLVRDMLRKVLKRLSLLRHHGTPMTDNLHVYIYIYIYIYLPDPSPSPPLSLRLAEGLQRAVRDLRAVLLLALLLLPMISISLLLLLLLLFVLLLLLVILLLIVAIIIIIIIISAVQVQDLELALGQRASERHASRGRGVGNFTSQNVNTFLPGFRADSSSLQISAILA